MDIKELWLVNHLKRCTVVTAQAGYSTLSAASACCMSPVHHARAHIALEAVTASAAPLVLGHRQAGEALSLDVGVQQVADDLHVRGVVPSEASFCLGILVLSPVLHF